jgi:hypothetical protein
MGKALQTTTRRTAAPVSKKPAKRPARPTLAKLNRLLTQDQGQVIRKAKANTLRLIGRETL